MARNPLGYGPCELLVHDRCFPDTPKTSSYIYPVRASTGQQNIVRVWRRNYTWAPRALMRLLGAAPLRRTLVPTLVTKGANGDLPTYTHGKPPLMGQER